MLRALIDWFSADMKTSLQGFRTSGWECLPTKAIVVHPDDRAIHDESGHRAFDVAPQFGRQLCHKYTAVRKIACTMPPGDWPVWSRHAQWAMIARLRPVRFVRHSAYAGSLKPRPLSPSLKFLAAPWSNPCAANTVYRSNSPIKTGKAREASSCGFSGSPCVVEGERLDEQSALPITRVPRWI